MNDTTFSYLASPYTAADKFTRERRFREVCRAAAVLMRNGKRLFVPIAHSHPIDITYAQPESGDFWKAQDAPFLHTCAELIVLMLPGWDESKGIAHEIEVSQERGIPIVYLNPLKLEAETA